MTATAFPKNPYIIGRPIHESANFYGREEIFQFIEDNLENKAQVILLFGQRRIGKSSILNQIPQAVNLEKFVFVLLSLQGKAHKSLGEVLFELATDIRDTIHNYLKKSEVDILIPSVEKFNQNHKIFVEQFLAQIYSTIKTQNLALLIDEFDVLEDTKKDSAINQFFPYLYSILPKQKQLYIIPVVGRKLDDMPNLLSLFKEAPYQKIGRLDKYDAKQLICKPTEGILNYDANSIQAILQLSGGHPYFTQLICFAIFGRLRQKQKHDVTKEDVTEIVDKAIEYGEGGLVWFYSGLNMPERLIFSVVAEVQEHKNINVWKFLKQQKIGKKQSLVDAYNRLLSWEFIKQEWQYIPASIRVEKTTVELVCRWLLKRHSAEQEIKIYQTELRAITIHQLRHNLRRYSPYLIVGLISILFVVWLASPSGKIQKFRWELTFSKLINRNPEDKAESIIARIKDYDELADNPEILRILEQEGIKILLEQEGSKILEQAFDSAKLIQDADDKARALIAIAKAYVELNQNPEAMKVLAQALDSANQSQDSYIKVESLIVIAEAYVELNQNPEAMKVLAQALDSANRNNDPFSKALSLKKITWATSRLNQNPEVIKILEQTLNSAYQIQDSYSKALSLTTIAQAYVELNQNPEAIKILEQALDSTNQIKYSIAKASLLGDIAEVTGKLNQNPEVIKILEEARNFADQLPDSNDKDRALEAISEALEKFKSNSEAIKIVMVNRLSQSIN